MLVYVLLTIIPFEYILLTTVVRVEVFLTKIPLFTYYRLLFVDTSLTTILFAAMLLNTVTILGRWWEIKSSN